MFLKIYLPFRHALHNSPSLFLIPLKLKPWIYNRPGKLIRQLFYKDIVALF